MLNDEVHELTQACSLFSERIPMHRLLKAFSIGLLIWQLNQLRIKSGSTAAGRTYFY